MRVLRSVSELRSALAPVRREQRSIGLVPTMGAFHDGHLSLIEAARDECDVVVVSLFVNPAQFNERNDLAAYPRDERRDTALAQDAGVDYLFAPPVQDVYPPGFSTTVSVAGVSERLEGAHRGAGHFDGVTTVVTKLLNMVGPDVAYFGQKDAQQAAVIRRLVSDLDMPVRIEVRPTIRAQDGVALSSRNARLSAAERHRAASLHRALQRIRESIQNGARDPAAARAAGLAELTSAGIEPDYLELVSPETFAPASTIDGQVLAVVAARVGNTRLIDNELIKTPDYDLIKTPNPDLIKTPNPDHQVATPSGAPTS